MPLRCKLTKGVTFSNTIKVVDLNAAFDDGYATPDSGTLEHRFIAARAIAVAHLPADAVTANKIADDAITMDKIAPAAIGAGLENATVDEESVLRVKADGSTMVIGEDGILVASQQLDVDQAQFAVSEGTPPVVALAEDGVPTAALAAGILTADADGRAKMADGFIVPALMLGVTGLGRLAGRGTYNGNDASSKTYTCTARPDLLLIIRSGLEVTQAIWRAGTFGHQGALSSATVTFADLEITVDWATKTYHNATGTTYCWIAVSFDNLPTAQTT